MKAQTHAVRSEVVRGVRWGAILVLTLLLALAGYRMLSSSAAVASTPKQEPVLSEDAGPAIEVQTEPGTILAEPDAAPRPVYKPRPASPTRADESVPPPPPVGKRFNAAPVAAPAPKTVEIADPLPEAESVAVDSQLPAPGGNAQLAPPPPGKPGAPAKIVRSVGRIFGIGKKENQDNSGK